MVCIGDFILGIVDFFQDVGILILESAMFWKVYISGIIIIIIDMIATILTFWFVGQEAGIIIASCSMSIAGLIILIALVFMLYFYFTKIHNQESSPSHTSMIAGQANMIILSFAITFILIGIIGLILLTIILLFFLCTDDSYY